MFFLFRIRGIDGQLGSAVNGHADCACLTKKNKICMGITFVVDHLCCSIPETQWKQEIMRISCGKSARKSIDR